jgi:hypothetical protein
MTREEQAKKIQKVIAKAWADEAFKQSLLANPAETLREQGIEAPPNVDVRVVECTDSVYYIVIPPRPAVAPDIEHWDDRIAPMCAPSLLLTWNLP